MRRLGRRAEETALAIRPLNPTLLPLKLEIDAHACRQLCRRTDVESPADVSSGDDSLHRLADCGGNARPFSGVAVRSRPQSGGSSRPSALPGCRLSACPAAKCHENLWLAPGWGLSRPGQCGLPGGPLFS